MGFIMYFYKSSLNQKMGLYPWKIASSAVTLFKKLTQVGKWNSSRRCRLMTSKISLHSLVCDFQRFFFFFFHVSRVRLNKPRSQRHSADFDSNNIWFDSGTLLKAVTDVKVFKVSLSLYSGFYDSSSLVLFAYILELFKDENIIVFFSIK